MTNDTKFGMVVGVALVLTTAVMFFQNRSEDATADAGSPATLNAGQSPPATPVALTGNR